MIKIGKTLRLNLRIKETDLFIIRERARARNMNLTEFIINAAKATHEPESRKAESNNMDNCSSKILTEILQLIHEQNIKTEQQNAVINSYDSQVKEFMEMERNRLVKKCNSLDDGMTNLEKKLAAAQNEKGKKDDIIQTMKLFLKLVIENKNRYENYKKTYIKEYPDPRSEQDLKILENILGDMPEAKGLFG